MASARAQPQHPPCTILDWRHSQQRRTTHIPGHGFRFATLQNVRADWIPCSFGSCVLSLRLVQSCVGTLLDQTQGLVALTGSQLPGVHSLCCQCRVDNVPTVYLPHILSLSLGLAHTPSLTQCLILTHTLAFRYSTLSRSSKVSTTGAITARSVQ